MQVLSPPARPPGMLRGGVGGRLRVRACVRACVQSSSAGASAPPGVVVVGYAPEQVPLILVEAAAAARGGGGAARCAAGGRACHPKRPQTGDFDRGYIPSATRACLCWLCHHELLSGGAGGIAVPGRGGATTVEVLEYSGRHALSLPEADLLRACECAPPPLPASPAGP
eukprot:SAG25_NODE_919_length_4769_cov_1.695289_6_plen_169_part_00